MKKRMMAAILAVVLVFSLTGCMNAQVEEKISKNGGYTCTMVMYFEKAAVVDYINRKIGSDHVSKVDKELKKEGYTIQTVDGKEYYVSKPEVKKSTVAKVAKSNQTDAVKGTYQIWETGLYMNLKVMAGDMDITGDLLSDADDLEITEKESKEILSKSYFEYSVVFDYDIINTDRNGVIDSQNPKKATWKFSMDSLDSLPIIQAYCKSDIKVSGVKQGATYKKAPKVKFSGVTSATYKGKKVKSGTTFKKNGQHTLILKAASGERRTVTFFVDKKKPVVSGIKNKKTYKKAVYFLVYDKDSGIASVKINGKKQDPANGDFFLSKNGTYNIVVKDKVGNTTKVKIKLKKTKKSKK